MYPVTVDPSFTTTATGDAYVQNAEFTVANPGADRTAGGHL